MTNFDSSVWRILDSSANRASEGLRTIEEHARLVLNDAFLSGQLKQLRHDVASACQLLARDEMLHARDTPGDVGTGIETATEYDRQSVESVVLAAAARVQQALRCLEEYSKTVHGEAARGFEACRYKSYTIFAAVERACRGDASRIADCVVYGLIDGGDSIESFVTRLRSLADAGVDVIQFRDKKRTDRELYHWARAGAETLRPLKPLFIINDRADLAESVKADGVHVGQDEMPVSAVRKIVGSAIVGVSTHDIHQARQAVLDGADYIGCGPTFASSTKEFETFSGTEFLREVSAEVTLPSFAIGGISTENIADVAACGFGRVAISGALASAENLSERIADYKSRLAAPAVT